MSNNAQEVEIPDPNAPKPLPLPDRKDLDGNEIQRRNLLNADPEFNPFRKILKMTKQLIHARNKLEDAIKNENKPYFVTDIDLFAT